MITLQITYDDLLQGIVNSPTSDPIALAAQRAGLQHPFVNYRSISFDHGLGRATLPFGPELRTFRRRLEYGDRHEMLRVKRDKKGEISSYESVVFQLKPPQATQVLPKAA